jgi:urease accessory protein
MSSTALLHEQRAVGHVKLHMGPQGVERLREQGSSRLRVPPGSSEAIIINTAGGLAGGDSISIELVARKASSLTATTQAAERAYRSLGPAARVTQSFTVEKGARLLWLPHETILFDGASLHRSIAVDVAPGGWFLGLESTVYGRTAMGETISSLHHREDWRITRGGTLIHAEAWKLDGALPTSSATLRGAKAIATLLLVADGSESRLPAARAVLEDGSAASAWNGKLVARLVAEDGFTLRKQLIRLVSVMAESHALPKVWTL